MPSNYDKLISLFRELFQMDQADLDFGIYRIMNAKRAEIDRFLADDLLPQAREAFTQYHSADRAVIQAELDQAIDQARGLGADTESLPRVQQLRRRLATEAVDVARLEDEVFSDLFNFFRRYYNEGDFISLRRYKEGVYAIPYEGEEVKLYWANHDQYYIKTTEYLRDYSFRLADGRRVHFKLVEAEEEEHGNVKPTNSRDRRFILDADNPLVEESGELVIRFFYQPVGNGNGAGAGAQAEQPAAEAGGQPEEAATGRRRGRGPTQAQLNAQAVQTILAVAGQAAWTNGLAQLVPTESNPNRTLLERHLVQYTARNTFDYFIHKDLGGFLRRELDFFIKNEVMHLDDVESESAARVEQYLSKIRVLRRIARKIIAFLAQIEDFQKKLWLKKKFVVETNWCLTLDHVLNLTDERLRDELLAAIAANDAQRAEWVRLFAIDEINADQLGQPAYSEPLTVDFLRANPFLVLDTAFFSQEFKDKLLASQPDLDEQTSGVLVHGDNFHGLMLLSERYRSSVDCMFLDPPYNTGLDEFPYKDNYQHSSWLSFLADRLILADSTLTQDGSIWITLDDNEASHCRQLVEVALGPDRFVAEIAWEKVYSPRMDAKQLSASFDHLLVFAKTPAWSPNHRTIEPDLTQFPHTDEKGRRYRSDPLRKWGKNSLRTDRPNLWYPIRSPSGVDVWPIKPDGTEGCWRWERKTVELRYSELDWLDKGNGLQPYLRQYAEDSTLRPVETLWP